MSLVFMTFRRSRSLLWASCIALWTFSCASMGKTTLKGSSAVQKDSLGVTVPTTIIHAPLSRGVVFGAGRAFLSPEILQLRHQFSLQCNAASEWATNFRDAMGTKESCRRLWRIAICHTFLMAHQLMFASTH